MSRSHAQGRARPILPARLDGKAPVDLLGLVAAEPEHPCERRRELELAARLDERVVDYLREDLRPVVAEHELRATREHRMRHAERPPREYLAAGRALRVADGAA